MSPSIALVVLAVAVAVGVACVWIALRRRAEWEARRAARFAELAARIGAAVSSIDGVRVVPFAHVDTPRPPAQDVDEGLPGRAALLRAAATQVGDARLGGRRLSAALVRTAAAGARELAVEAHAVADVPAYAVGPQAVAIVLPGLGRADALGLLARIEARCPSSGKAVELEPGEDAVELVARLLTQGRSGAADT